MTDGYRSLLQDWYQLRRGAPGKRFQEFYNNSKLQRGKGWSISRLLKLTLGIVLILIGPVVGLAPGPGGLLVVGIGLLLVARQLRLPAQILDWLEPKLRRTWLKAKQIWRSLPALERVAMIALALVVGVAASYFTFTAVNG